MISRTTTNKGFTLIELMVVVAIVALLTAIAVPSYQNFVTRSKAAELISFGASSKSDIDAYVAANGKFPKLNDIRSPTNLIRRVEFWRPSCSEMWIHVYPTKEFHADVSPGKHAYIFQGKVDENNNVTWACTFHPTFRKLPKEFFPSSCQENIARNVRAKAC